MKREAVGPWTCRSTHKKCAASPEGQLLHLKAQLSPPRSRFPSVSLPSLPSSFFLYFFPHGGAGPKRGQIILAARLFCSGTHGDFMVQPCSAMATGGQGMKEVSQWISCRLSTKSLVKASRARLLLSAWKRSWTSFALENLSSTALAQLTEKLTRKADTVMGGRVTFICAVLTFDLWTQFLIRVVVSIVSQLHTCRSTSKAVTIILQGLESWLEINEWNRRLRTYWLSFTIPLRP